MKRAGWWAVCGAAVLSCFFCLALGTLWLRGRRGQGGIEIRCGGLPWQLSVRDNRLQVDNEPHRRAERAKWERQCAEAHQACLRAASEERDPRGLNMPLLLEPWSDFPHPHDPWFSREKFEQQIRHSRTQATEAWQQLQAHPPSIATVSWSTRAEMPLLASALLPAFSATAVMSRVTRRRRRASAGRCVRCGYDLRAAVAMCPECGSKVDRINVWSGGQFLGYLRCQRLHGDELFTYPIATVAPTEWVALRRTAGSGERAIVEVVLADGFRSMLVASTGRRSLTLAPLGWFARKPQVPATRRSAATDDRGRGMSTATFLGPTG